MESKSIPNAYIVKHVLGRYLFLIEYYLNAWLTKYFNEYGSGILPKGRCEKLRKLTMLNFWNQMVKKCALLEVSSVQVFISIKCSTYLESSTKSASRQYSYINAINQGVSQVWGLSKRVILKWSSHSNGSWNAWHNQIISWMDTAKSEYLEPHKEQNWYINRKFSIIFR